MLRGVCDSGRTPRRIPDYRGRPRSAAILGRLIASVDSTRLSGLLFTLWRAAVLPLLGEHAQQGSDLGAILTLDVIVLWAGRTTYERITVREDAVVKVTGAGLLAAVTGLTLYVGLASTISGAYGEHREV